MRPTMLTSEEIAARGIKIYEDVIRSRVERDHQGDFVVIDIDSGDYEIDPKDIEASTRLKQRRPEAILFGLRVVPFAGPSFASTPRTGCRANRQSGLLELHPPCRTAALRF